jgi:hypothetical protein
MRVTSSDIGHGSQLIAVFCNTGLLPTCGGPWYSLRQIACAGFHGETEPSIRWIRAVFPPPALVNQYARVRGKSKVLPSNQSDVSSVMKLRSCNFSGGQISLSAMSLTGKPLCPCSGRR